MVIRRIAGVLITGMVFGACGSGTGPTPPPPPVSLQRIDISGVPASWTAGQTVPLTATAVFSNSTTQNITTTATWASSVPSVATVAAGVVTVLASGTTVITASSQGIASGGVSVTVATGPTTFTLLGTIRQGSATPIVGATVLILDGANANKSATTDGAGIYRLSALLPGTFRVRATATGFDSTEFNATISNADVVSDFQMTPTVTLRANPGGPYTAIHDTSVTFDGLASTVTGATITRFDWNCGQGSQYGSGCDQNNPRPTFNYRKCGSPPTVSNRPACLPGSTTVAEYTVTLKVTDSLNRTHTATTTVRVTNRY